MLARYRASRTFKHCWWECKMVQSLWETIWQYLHVHLRPTFPLLGIYPTVTRTHGHHSRGWECSQQGVHINPKQPLCPPTVVRLNSVLCTTSPRSPASGQKVLCPLAVGSTYCWKFSESLFQELPPTLQPPSRAARVP